MMTVFQLNADGATEDGWYLADDDGTPLSGGWYWQVSDGDPVGPFESETDAIANAQERQARS